jgi:hypothetical protein
VRSKRLTTDEGPLIRIAPNEVSFYSRDIYDAVHKVGSKFKKDPRTYGEFVQGGHPALFSITCVYIDVIIDLQVNKADWKVAIPLSTPKEDGSWARCSAEARCRSWRLSWPGTSSAFCRLSVHVAH